MILVDCGPQGDIGWRMARIGKPTASVADMIVTPKTLRASAQQEALIDRLAAETVLGCPLDDVNSAAMARGQDLEEEARSWLAFDLGVDIETVGLITTDDGRVGCSPDGWIRGDESEGVEIKNPLAHTHVGYLRRGGLVEAYKTQVQFSLWVTKWPRWRLLTYNPVLPSRAYVVLPDAEYQAALDREMPPFLARLDEAVAVIRSMAPVA